MSKELRIVGRFHSNSGYSRHTRGLLLTALRAGYSVQAVESLAGNGEGPDLGHVPPRRREASRLDIGQIPPEQREAVHDALRAAVREDAPSIIVNLPLRIRRWAHYPGARIAYTQIECDQLTPDAIESLLTADLVVVPSTHVARVFENHLGGRREVVVFPAPVESTVFTPQGAVMDLPGPALRFGYVGSTHARKHWQQMMGCFAEQFAGTNVGLICKISSNPGDVDDLAWHCCRHGAHVQVIHGVWSDQQLAAFYRAIDCYVGVGMEGFGLPFVEAAHCGTPSVALNAGGATDVVRPGTGYVVDSCLESCRGLSPTYFRSDFVWHAPQAESLKAAYQRAVEDHASGLLPTKGLAARNYCQRFLPDSLTGHLDALVERAMSAHHGARTRSSSEGLLISHDEVP